jgi:hypothetical protein
VPLCSTSSLTRSVRQNFIFLENHISKLSMCILFVVYFPKCPRFNTIYSYAANAALY